MPLPIRKKSYPASLKLSVIKRAEEIGNRGAAREFDVDESCIRRWRAEKDIISQMPKEKRARRNGTVAWPVLEDNLATWLMEQKDKGLTISTKMICFQAKLIADLLGIKDFKADTSWCFRFKKRKNFLAVKRKKNFPVIRTPRKKIDTSSEESDDSRCSFEEITSDVEENTEQPTQNQGYENFLSNSDIVIKQEIIETEQESSVFDHSLLPSESQSDGLNSIETRLDSIRPSTSHSETQFDGQRPSTSHSETQFDGQIPSTSHSETQFDGQKLSPSNVSNSKFLNLPTVTAESNVSENSTSVFSKKNGTSSVKPTTSDSSKEPIRTEVPTQTESPSLPEVITSDVYMCENGSAQSGVSPHSCSLLPVRDKFDALGELIALRLRKLDPQSSAYVQTAFLDILSKAESGVLLNNNEKDISAAQCNNIQKDTLSNESKNVSDIENITPEARQATRNPASNWTKLFMSSKNPIAKPKLSSSEAHQLDSESILRNNTCSENSLGNRPEVSSIEEQSSFSPVINNPHIGNPLPLVLHNTVPENQTVCDVNQTGVSSHMVAPSLSLNLNYASPCSGSHRFPFQMRARDEFDAYGEFVAAKLRNLDQRSCAFVQSGFANLIFEAELGRFLSKGEKSIFANKTNEILRNVPPPSGSELGILTSVA